MTEKPNPTTSPWINVHEAAEYLDVCVDTIYDACAAGGLKHVRLGRRTIRLKREGSRHGRKPRPASRSERALCLAARAVERQGCTKSTTRIVQPPRQRSVTARGTANTSRPS